MNIHQTDLIKVTSGGKTEEMPFSSRIQKQYFTPYSSMER